MDFIEVSATIGIGINDDMFNLFINEFVEDIKKGTDKDLSFYNKDSSCCPCLKKSEEEE